MQLYTAGLKRLFRDYIFLALLAVSLVSLALLDRSTVTSHGGCTTGGIGYFQLLAASIIANILYIIIREQRRTGFRRKLAKHVIALISSLFLLIFIACAIFFGVYFCF